MRQSLFCFGFGFTARALAARLSGWQVAGTARNPKAASGLIRFDDAETPPASCLTGVTHLLLSIPPGVAGDPVLTRADLRDALPSLRWIGYLSTTGVYGDHGGAWVDEATPAKPGSERTRRRAQAEQAWLDFGATHGIRTQIFRLAGIYGPGRSVLDDIRAGTAQRVIKPGQWFSRIHVADIALTLERAIAFESPHTLFNVCDDLPAASADPITFGCALLGVAPPPEIPFDRATLSPMAQSFWADNKRVRNDRIKNDLGVRLLYPTYREGLTAIKAETEPEKR